MIVRLDSKTSNAKRVKKDNMADKRTSIPSTSAGKTIWFVVGN